MPPIVHRFAGRGRTDGHTLTVETLGTKEVFANQWMTLREDTVRRPDGSISSCTVVDAAPIALVIPTDGERFHLVEQYRHPVAGRRWEFPSGTTDPNMDTDAASVAARELREETGLVAGNVTTLGTLEITPSTFSQTCAVFLATDLTAGVPQRDPEEQDMQSAWFTRTQVERMMRDGTISDSKTIAAYALLLVS